MVARQRRQKNIGRRRRVNPDCLVNLLARRDIAGHIDSIKAGLHPPAGFVRGDGVELAEKPDRGTDRAATQFLRDFA